MHSSIFAAAPRPGQVTPTAPSPRLAGVHLAPAAAPPPGATPSERRRLRGTAGLPGQRRRRKRRTSAAPMPTSTSRATPTHTQSRGSELKETATAPHPGEHALLIKQPILSSTTPSGPPEGADHVAALLDAAAPLSARVPSTMASSPVSSATTWPSSTRWTATAPSSPALSAGVQSPAPDVALDLRGRSELAGILLNTAAAPPSDQAAASSPRSRSSPAPARARAALLPGGDDLMPRCEPPELPRLVPPPPRRRGGAPLNSPRRASTSSDVKARGRAE
uniref:Uncharacterized protein n=1 Tax=Sorangium cellulosum TaxID=56 RepID=A0A3S7UZZ4_SORCE|nr:hypothetical protein [Sorangium cellulosum]